MDTRVTQCPRCGTSFRVTDALLAVAAGAVRCGSCLHIFNAREHWLDDKEKEKAAEAKKAESTPTPIRPLQAGNAKAERREPVIDDDALFDDDSPLFNEDDDNEGDDQGRTIFNPAGAEFTPAEGEESSIFGDLMADNDWLTPNQISFGEPVRSDEEADADRWAEELLREETPRADPAPSGETTAPLELSEADRKIQRLSIISDYQLEHDDILASVPETEENQDNDEYIVLDLPSAYDPGLGRTPPPEEAADTANSGVDSDDDGFSAGDRIGADTDVPARRRNTEPLRPHQFLRERRWPKVLWGLGLVIALALLPAQYLYFNFDDLARGELRPWLAEACDVVGCQLPPQSDPAHIRTGSLIVRSHPTARGALAVDAIITNLAPFAQPYPELVLQFTDINGSPVAGRRFTPAEYLGGELTGSHLMPIGQPIHIGLEVKDPGPKAVNYLLAVSAAQP